MRIDRFKVMNFRGFEEREFEFSIGFNVFVGDNGSGKTAVLDALALGLRSPLEALTSAPRSTSDSRDQRMVSAEQGGVLTISAITPIRVEFRGYIDGAVLDWTRIFDSAGERRLTIGSQSTDSVETLPWLDQEARQRATDLLSRLSSKTAVALPLIAHFGTDRLFRIEREPLSETFTPGSRLRGYDGCLDAASTAKWFVRWMKTQELQALQEGSASPVLAAVKTAISSGVQGCSEVGYNVRHDDLLVTMGDRRKLPFRMLSDGQRNMVALVADLASRCAVLNPHLGVDAAKLTPGVVLIDEIDLHLHPKWQRRVVEDLRNTFPEVQFFATTHSPFIIQSLKEHELINLDPTPPADYVDRSIEDIAEDVMGVEVPQRSERFQNMMAAAEAYYAALEKADGADAATIEQLKLKLDELSEPFSDNPAFTAILRAERVARGLGRGTPGDAA